MHFYKYEGTGNDFIIIDNRSAFFSTDNKSLVLRLCDRKFGIGADGLMLLENAEGCDFRMVYYNADGAQSSMCGNGGRCISHFARYLGLVKEGETWFEAIDGLHSAVFLPDGNIKLKMNDIAEVRTRNEDYVLDTGSPHFVHFTANVFEDDIIKKGREIRYSMEFEIEGINVNLISHNNGEWYMRTYERGVEDETLSCGTGTVAAAACIALIQGFEDGQHSVELVAPGGILNVQFEKDKETFKQVYLTGAVRMVFSGEIEITG